MRLREIIIAIVGVVLGGVCVFALFGFANIPFHILFGNGYADQIAAWTSQIKLPTIGGGRPAPNEAEEFFYKPLATRTPEIPKTGKAVYADLNSMTLSLYEDGVQKAEYPIASKGKPGSYWETPTGEYRVLTKEDKHFSSIGEVWMPYSVGFFGNFFIHGWPYYPGGKEVPRGFSGGCIRLETDAAKAVYEFVGKNTPIFVTEANVPGAGERSYMTLRHSNPPHLSAKAFMIADVDNNFTFLDKDRSKARSIASITKLMSAIISLEAVDQNRIVSIDAADVDIYGDLGNLVKGEHFTARDMLAPLLLSSSNDAAYAIARLLGTDRFVSLMNDKARALGLEHTHYTDPSGLQLENSSTPEDLLSLIKYIRDVRTPILEMSRTRKVSLRSDKAAHTWFNYNWKSDDPEFLGGKIGYLDASGKTMVGLFRLPMSEFASRDIGVVVLGSNDQSGDVKKLTRWVQENFIYGNVPRDTRLSASPFTVTDSSSADDPLSMLFVGDLMLNRGIEKIIQDKKTDFSFPFAYTGSTISDADIAFGNLEGPISDKGTNHGSIYSFRMNPDVVKALYDAGFDVVSFANNHVGDYGREAMEDTFRRLYRAGILYAGAGWNKEEALKPRIIERGGRRIGFLAFSDVGPSWLQAGDTSSGIAIADPETVKEAVRQAKPQVDILVVSFHFGEEYETHSRARQQELAHAAIDAGASVVVGHHPHVVQEIEQYKGGVIAYSLGNFIFDQAFSPETRESMALRLHFKGEKITQIESLPVSFNEFFQPSIGK